MGQICQVLAKQPVQRLREIYKRKFKYPMQLSGFDPFVSTVTPYSDYVLLSLPGRPDVEVPVVNDESSQASEGSAGSGMSESDETDADLPAIPKGEGSVAEKDDDVEMKSAPAASSSALALSSAARSKISAAAASSESKSSGAKASAYSVALEVALFAENAFVDDLLEAGPSRYGRRRRITSRGASSLYSHAD